MSFAAETEKLTEQLIQAEYKNACEKFGNKYSSLHEGYAVLKEEVEEVRDEYNSLLSNYHYLWENIKDNDKDILSTIIEMQIDVIRQIKEASQIGAVLQKIKNTLEKSDDADVSTKRKVCNPDCECIHKEFDKWTCWGQKNSPYVELGDECPYKDEVEK